jgi:hypothetical protein
MPLNRRGQVSFEILLLTAIIFTMAIWISSYYFLIKDNTLAMQLAKIHALKQIGEDESGTLYTIAKIGFKEIPEPAEELILEIDTRPADFPASGFACGELQATVSENTKYKPESKVSILLNGNDCT